LYKSSDLNDIFSFVKISLYPVPYSMDIGGFFPGIKRPGLEADRSPPTRGDVKKALIYTSTLTLLN
jgi:hypothetical protein